MDFFKIISIGSIITTASVLVSCETDAYEFDNSYQWVDGATFSDIKPVNNEIGDGWNLVFSDEFNDNEINFDKWTINLSTSTRSPRPYLGISEWYWRPENVEEKNGNLVLKVKKVGSDVMHCGSIFSKDKYKVKYGYFEAKIKVADMKKATHTAFWLQSSNQGNVDGTGNDGAEVDIFESAYLDEKSASTIHIDGYSSPNHQEEHKEYVTEGIHDDYQVWGCLWNENTLKIYYNGDLKAEFGKKWIPQVEEYIQFSTGATFSGEGDFINQPADSWLSEAYVDYVRIWSLNK